MTSPIIPPINYVRPIKYYDGFADVKGDEHLRLRYFTYEIPAGLGSGVSMDIMFTIDRPAKEVWDYVRDFNWMNKFNHYYSGVVGDREGKTFALGADPNNWGPHHYHVLRVIPEYLIVVYQPIFPAGEGPTYLPGLGCDGAVSPGFHVVMLSEHDGKTTFITYMEHSALMTRDAKQMTDEEAIAPWRGATLAPEWHRKWRDDFIAHLKQLIQEGKKA